MSISAAHGLSAGGYSFAPGCRLGKPHPAALVTNKLDFLHRRLGRSFRRTRPPFGGVKLKSSVLIDRTFETHVFSLLTGLCLRPQAVWQIEHRYEDIPCKQIDVPVIYSNIVDGFVFEADGCKVSIQVASGLRVLHAKVKGFLCIAHGCSFAEASTLFCTLPRVFTYLR